MNTPVPPPERYAALLEAGGLLTDDEGPVTFEVVVRRSVELVPGCDGCGITVEWPGSAPQTRAATDAATLAADRRQYELGQGPCLDSAESGASLLAGDLETDPRWPLWSPHAVHEGFRSVLSIQLHTEHEAIGALNLYGRKVDAFSGDAIDLAEILAMHAAAALDAAELATGLRTAQRARHVIGIAQGVLAMRYELTYEQAFDLLRRVSAQSGLDLRDVADRIATERRLPDDVRIDTSGDEPPVAVTT